MRMNAGGAPQHPGVLRGERECLLRAGQIRAGDNLAAHAGGQRPLHDIRQVGAKARMSEVGADVDQVQGQVASFACGIVRTIIVLPRMSTKAMLRKAMLLVLLGMPLVALAQAGGDLQAQIVYAYQTEDLNALLDLEAGLRTRVAAG